MGRQTQNAEAGVRVGLFDNHTSRYLNGAWLRLAHCILDSVGPDMFNMRLLAFF